MNAKLAALLAELDERRKYFASIMIGGEITVPVKYSEYDFLREEISRLREALRKTDEPSPVCWIKHGPYKEKDVTEFSFANPNDDVCWSPLYAHPEREGMVSVPRTAWDGFVSLVNVRLGKPTNRDKTPEQLIAMARAMLTEAEGE